MARLLLAGAADDFDYLYRWYVCIKQIEIHGWQNAGVKGGIALEIIARVRPRVRGSTPYIGH